MTLLPFTIWDCPWLAPCALVLDLLLGDPVLPWPHPVCLVGKGMHTLEKLARSFIALFPSGLLHNAIAVIAGFLSLILCTGLVAIFARVPLCIPYFNYLFALYLAWAGLAGGCLLRTGKIVLERVENSSLPQAREACSWLVSRDVSQMDRSVLRKTLADTLSENFTDAFVAPFFWLLLTGPVGLWIYKTVSTMDSQWGYMTPAWRYLGYAGARGDDILAWLPARLSVLLLYFTDRILSLSPAHKIWRGQLPSLRLLSLQARGMPSPNSGWSMSACAWLCNARMAGSSVYFGKLVSKPWLGPPPNQAIEWNRKTLLALCKLIFYSCIIGGLILWLAALFLSSIVKLQM